MNKLKRILILVLVFVMFVNVAAVSKAASRKRVSFQKIKGQGYVFEDVKSINISGEKVTIKGTLNRILPSGNYKKLAKKKSGYHFPSVYFWTSNGKIVSYATSA